MRFWFLDSLPATGTVAVDRMPESSAETAEETAEETVVVADTYAETEAATRPPPDEASASADEHELAFLNSFLDLVRRIAAAASPPPSASP